MSDRPRMGLIGGTFDPVHYGHLAAARAAQQALALSQVRFLPAAHPPHRPESPRASGYDRTEMIRRAIGAETGWEVSDLELRRNGPSYTFDTLSTMHREGLSPSQLFFILGADAFAEIATWHRYPDVLDAAHFVVVTRPGISLDALRARVPSVMDRVIEPADVAKTATPGVVFVAADTPDVSSTEIRARAARGDSLDGLVPPAVAAYIAQNQLYRTAPDAPDAAVAPGAPCAPGGE